MTSSRKIVTIDSSPDMQSFYEQALADTDYRILGRAEDGRSGLQIIREGMPDIVITEIILPGMDGLELLEKLYKSPDIRKKPAVLIVSTVRKQEITELAFKSGASYYMIKPLSRQTLLRRLDQVYDSSSRLSEPASALAAVTGPGDRLGNRDLADLVSRTLRGIGVPAHIKGYQYLRDCLMIAVEYQEVIHSVTKSLYPTAARMNHTTTGSVERSIRNAIQITFSREHTPLLKKIFSYGPDQSLRKPPSAEFIAILAEYIRML